MTDKQYLLRAAQQAVRKPVHPIIEKLRRLRVANGLSQRKLADLVGYCPQTFCAFETGLRHPDLKILTDWAQALNCEITIVWKKEDRALMPGEL